MAKITVQHRFGDGSMGDGWADNGDAANALASEINAVWSEDLKMFADAGHDFHITVEVLRNTTGGDATSIEVTECDDGLETYQLEKLVESALTDTDSVFDHLCQSEEFEYLAA